MMDRARIAKFTIGQIVRHRVFPFRGVVFDVDPVFDNTEEWWLAIPEDVRPAKDQPYYHLLAENAESEYIAYVSEQNLLPDESGEPLRHPQISEFFDGPRRRYLRRPRPRPELDLHGNKKGASPKLAPFLNLGAVSTGPVRLTGFLALLVDHALRGGLRGLLELLALLDLLRAGGDRIKTFAVIRLGETNQRHLDRKLLIGAIGQNKGELVALAQTGDEIFGYFGGNEAARRNVL